MALGSSLFATEAKARAQSEFAGYLSWGMRQMSRALVQDCL